MSSAKNGFRQTDSDRLFALIARTLGALVRSRSLEEARSIALGNLARLGEEETLRQLFPLETPPPERALAEALPAPTEAFHRAGGSSGPRELLREAPNRLLLLHRLEDRIRRNASPFRLLLIRLEVPGEEDVRSGGRLMEAAEERLERVLGRSAPLLRDEGSRFAALLPGESGAGSVLQLIRRISRAFEAPLPVGGGEERLLVSLGVAAFPGDGSSARDLLGAADLAEEEARKAPSRTAIFEPSLRKRALRRSLLEKALRRTLERRGIQVHYQPLVRSQDRAVVGVEALARWFVSPGRSISPDEFVPLAEEAGLIVPLGAQVLERACREALRWRIPEHLALAVNVSAAEIRDPGFGERVEATLRETRFPPERLILEITESVLMTASDRFVHVTRHLRGLGIRFFLDDFGAGWCNFSYILTHQFEGLKIDRAFARDTDADPLRGVMLRSICRMAREMGLDCILEGIETERQHRLALEMGCEQAQGFLYGRPMPPETIARALRERPGGPITAPGRIGEANPAPPKERRVLRTGGHRAA
jgi:EAL domain-containing protein (putative c-di-GMP-specific phosphodiesterase class I)/GGDEF domain-containing protein